MAISKNTEGLNNELDTQIWRIATNLVHSGKKDESHIEMNKIIYELINFSE